jgi:sarcosine oxidase subunit beta
MAKELQKTSEVVIIGGGIIGNTIAYNLAKKGQTDVVILEKEPFLAAGSTGLCAGGIRQQFSSAINVEMMIKSVRIFEDFQEEMECDTAFDQKGYMFVASNEPEFSYLKKNYEMQQEHGLKEVRLIDTQEAEEIFPQMNTEDIVGGTFCPTDGFADPHEITQGYANQSKKMGVTIYTNTEVKNIIKEKDIFTVETTNGTISTPIVVNAAGPYCHVIGNMLGVDIPALPYPRQLFVSTDFPKIPTTVPMLVDVHSGLYLRKEHENVMIGLANQKAPSTFNCEVDEEFFFDVTVPALLHRVPVMEELEIMNNWAGLYSITPDHHPVLGRVPEVENFICACGFSGHGFMNAPIVGVLMTEEILDGEVTTVDISSLSIERFEEGTKGMDEAVVI